MEARYGSKLKHVRVIVIDIIIVVDNQIHFDKLEFHLVLISVRAKSRLRDTITQT